MHDQWKEAVSSINAYVEELKKNGSDTAVTLATFDFHGGLKFDILRDKCKPADWEELTVSETSPRGTTPLYDAIGAIVRRATDADHKRSVVVIMTDGLENASEEFSKDEAKRILDKCRKRDWQVMFLGANFDAMPQASSLGNSTRFTLNIAPMNLRASMSRMADATTTYAASGVAMAFSDEDRKRAGFRTTS